jgi:hypothetical protein
MKKNLVISVSELNDQNLMSISWLVSRFKPFYAYSFGLMLDKLYEQLKHKTNITITLDGKLVAYAGWFITDQQKAEEWYLNKVEAMPLANPDGDAVIVTVVVSQSPVYLRVLIRSISHLCAGKKVYRKRSFMDQREDMYRPPITGRLHRLP